MIAALDRMVANMMQRYGTVAYLQIVTGEEYNVETRENVITTADYRVKACFFDYLDKKSGMSEESGTLIRTGDKQVYIQPPHKTTAGIPLPALRPERDRLKIEDKIYKIVAVKEYNPSMSRAGCVLYEAYVRE